MDSDLRDLSIECRQQHIYQHLARRQSCEAAAVEHEVVDAQLNERLHLLNDLRGSANKILAHLVRALLTQHSQPLSRQLRCFRLARSADTASSPYPPHGRWVAPNFVAR